MATCNNFVIIKMFGRKSLGVQIITLDQKGQGRHVCILSTNTSNNSMRTENLSRVIYLSRD